MKWSKLAVVPAIVASLVLLQPTVADAGRWHHHHHNGIGPGLFIGAAFGLIAGAAIASSQNNNNYYYNSGYYGPGYYGSCKRVIRVCRYRYGPWGRYQRCTRRVRWVC